jgi:hypothetical protein
MGCDIHVVIEVRESGRWSEISYGTVYAFKREEEPGLGEGLLVCPEPFHSRNYDLFGIIANVRNGSGFAGIVTGNGWPSIAADRGFPPGFNPEAVAPDLIYQGDGPRWLGDHSFTWVELSELEAFDWDGVKTTQYGVVSADEYERLLAAQSFRPDSYCGGVSGPGVRVYSPQEYAIAKLTGLAAHPYVRVAWEDSARDATYDWAGVCLPWLREIAAGRPLRLVMGFDS